MKNSQTIASDLARWARDEALPFWAENGVDNSYGGFIEELNFSGEDACLPHKRTRVTCRQVYVYSHAKALGWADHLPLIQHGLDFLTSKAWQGDDKGFARRLTREGNVLDPTADLYDHAFALYAFAWAYHATGDSTCQQWAHKTLDLIESQLSHPSSRGFWHELPPEGWRLQNPHMHLLEASLAAFNATSEERFQNMAVSVAQLFKEHFFNRDTGTLAEYFADDWSIANDPKGRIAEPGHQLEWIWILYNCEQVSDLNFDGEIDAMMDFSQKHGINNKTGLVMNSVRDDGAVIDAGSRTWPNTEQIKAAVALLERHGEDQKYPTEKILAETGSHLLNKYLSSHPAQDIPKGTWIDSFDSEGNPNAKRIPASTLYHLFLAIAEFDRLYQPKESVR